MAERKAARITPFSAGECVKHIPSQFELVLVASNRMRELQRGAEPMVQSNDDHNMTIALREISEGKVGREYLTKGDNRNVRKVV
jgi:DNA-directed RNA polymerase subunit omega